MNDNSIIITFLKNIKSVLDCQTSISKYSSAMICVDNVYYVMIWSINTDGSLGEIKYYNLAGELVESPI